jgi:hypothetical protein
MVGGLKLDVISPGGCIAATATMAQTNARVCANGIGDVLPPPVSASNTRVYYRDGATAIRSIAPGEPAASETTVPGSATTVSSFSVSPDGRRIAVVVEDGSNPSAISLRLYVEDVRGGGHHADIYSTTTPNGKGGTTLWPMGWHGNSLVLAVVTACSFEPLQAPLAWHISDSATGRRLATIDGTSCVLNWWPSPAGPVCVDGQIRKQAFGYDWTGVVRQDVPAGSADYQGGLSPSGQALFLDQFGGPPYGVPPASTRLERVAPGASVTVRGHGACLWIDDSTVLAPDALIAYPPGSSIALPANGICAGRFPGGL